MALSRDRDWDFSEQIGEAGVEAAVDCIETEETSEHTEAPELTLLMLMIFGGLDLRTTGAGGNGNAVDLLRLDELDTVDIAVVEVDTEDTNVVDTGNFTSADSVLVSLNEVLV